MKNEKFINVSSLKNENRESFQKSAFHKLDISITDISHQMSLIVFILAIMTNILSIIGGVYGIYSYIFEHTNITWLAWTFSILLISMLEIASTFFFWSAWTSLFSRSMVNHRHTFVVLFSILGFACYFQSYRATTAGFYNFGKESDHVIKAVNSSYSNDSIKTAQKYETQISAKNKRLEALYNERDRINANYGKNATYNDKITNNNQIQFTASEIKNLTSEKNRCLDTMTNFKYRTGASESIKMDNRAKENFNFAIIILIAMPLLYFLYNMLHWFTLKEMELLENLTINKNKSVQGGDEVTSIAAFDATAPE